MRLCTPHRPWAATFLSRSQALSRLALTVACGVPGPRAVSRIRAHEPTSGARCTALRRKISDSLVHIASQGFCATSLSPILNLVWGSREGGQVVCPPMHPPTRPGHARKAVECVTSARQTNRCTPDIMQRPKEMISPGLQVTGASHRLSGYHFCDELTFRLFSSPVAGELKGNSNNYTEPPIAPPKFTHKTRSLFIRTS
jgi:hypothetical protein